MILEPDALSIGASGAIFGLMGAYLVLARARGISVMQSGIGPVILLNLAITFTIPGISKGAHIGGLIGGAALGWVMIELAKRPQLNRNPGPGGGDLGGRVRGAAGRRVRARALQVPAGLTGVDAFSTLAGRVSGELEERGSRFLAIAEPVLDRAGAEAFFAREARAHRNPTHVVPAFRLRDGTEFSSDAGEPAGSAGAPLLAALARSRAARRRGGRRPLVRRHQPRRGRPRARLRRRAGAGARRRAPPSAASALPRCASATGTSRRPRSCAA